jgi:hypothetical protein
MVEAVMMERTSVPINLAVAIQSRSVFMAGRYDLNAATSVRILSFCERFLLLSALSPAPGIWKFALAPAGKLERLGSAKRKIDSSATFLERPIFDHE